MWGWEAPSYRGRDQDASLELFGVVAYPGTLSPEVERALAALKTNNSVRTETDETIRTSRF
jgi:hypothetical protein